MKTIDWITITSVVSSTGSRPFYGTIWFSVVATIVVVLAVAVTAASLPDIGGVPVRGGGQFGVVLVAAYWVIVFPKLRKSRRGEKPESDPHQAGKADQ